jgi:ABC-type sulfate transport system permease subunit
METGEKAEIIQESMIDSILPPGARILLTVKTEKINIFLKESRESVMKGVKNDLEVLPSDAHPKAAGNLELAGGGLLLLFLVFFIYPCVRLMWEAFYTEKTGFTLGAFAKFFEKSYYWNTILNSFKVSGAVMLISLVLGVPFSYFFSFYRLKGRRVLFVLALLCTMSAPFIGAYSWIMLLAGPA